jgi:hypothetical protein
VGPSIKGGNNVAGRRARRESDRLCSDNEAGGRDGMAEKKPEESEHGEGHVALER